ncbi:MAG: carboxypeptidase-like regulatory domain-containing protein [Bryobacterales bacterium]|nr:carboxypeptidase-like regulatory domain-containing protein [Bryobacterales bacterium]
MDRSRRLANGPLLLGVAAASCLIAQAADTGSSIGGIVRAASGRALPEAAVTIIDAARRVLVEAETDGAGAFAASQLPEGTFSIRVELDGFHDSLQDGIRLAAGQIVRQDVVLIPEGTGRRVRPGGPGASTVAARPVLGGNGTQSRTGPSAFREMLGSGTSSGTALGKLGGSQQGERVRSTADVSEMRQDKAAARFRGSRPRGYFSSTRKPGTNEIHGALYHSLGNDALNARGFFGAESNLRRNEFGAYAGGPLIKNKTYFTYHYARLALRAGRQSGFGGSTPVDAFRQGDFQQLITRRPVAFDALGRAMVEGQIFDPASTRTLRGMPLRDPFANNLIPAGHPMRSRVAASVMPLMVRPERPGLEFNVQGRPIGDQTWSLDSPSHHFRLDHSFEPSVQASLTFSRTSHPSIRNCGGVDGCRAAFNPVHRPEGNADYFGSGIYEDITTHHVRQRLDWIASPGLLNQLTVGYDEFHVRGHSISAGADWPDRLWGPAGNGLIEADAGPPAMGFTGNTRYSPLGNGWGRSGFRANHEYWVANDLTWQVGRHTLKFGGEYRLHLYPFRGWASNVAGRFNFNRIHTGGFDAQGNNRASTGDPFASFLLGQVNSTQFEIPDLPTMIENFVSWSIVDQYRFTDRLTVTLGLRFDYQTAIRELDDNMSTFDPSVPNPGASGRLGAMIFAGKGPLRTGTRTLESPPRDAFGPRVGFAYRMGEQTVVRGGYGIYYSRVPHARFAAVNTLGFKIYATALDLSNGQQAAYFLDDGVPQGNIVLPPSIDPAIGNNTTTVAVTRDRATLPRVQDWSWAIQRQVTRTASVDLGYSGNRGSRLITDRHVLGPAANANAPSILNLGSGTLGAPVGAGIANAAGIATPYAGFGGSVAQALRPFPHMLDIGYLNVPAGNSFFHSLRTAVEKRFSSGGQLHATYAWSKLTGMGAGIVRPADGLGHGPQNPTDTQALERGLSADDVPHRIFAAFTHEVPIYRERRAGLVAKVLGGWTVSGIVRVTAGTPVNIVMANDLEPFLFNGQKRPDILSNRVRVNHGGSFDADTHSFFDRRAFADPGPLRFGNASRTMGFARGFRDLAEDLALFKDTSLGHRLKLRFETQVGNVFNRVVFCDPNRNWSSRSFGRAYAQCNSPRSVQFGLRLDF